MADTGATHEQARALRLGQHSRISSQGHRGMGHRGTEIWGRGAWGGGGVEAGPGNDVFLEKLWSADWIEQPGWRHLDSFSAKLSDISSPEISRIMIRAYQRKSNFD